MTAHDFSDIRPYDDSEVVWALAEAIRDEHMWANLTALFPQLERARVETVFREIDSVATFQTRIMEPAVTWAIVNTMMEFTVSGLDDLAEDRRYLFISNHRDITLDSALLAWSSHHHWGRTMEMAIGDNLLSADWMVHLFKLNKTVIVARGLSPRDLLASSKKLSAYIHQQITGGGESFWIAQAEGRSKDGKDRTHSGLVKMLTLAGGKDWQHHLRELAPVPVAISYEWDPCDLLKARERLARQRGIPYQKPPGGDVESIALGIMAPKGRVHLSVGVPLTESWSPIASAGSRNEGIEAMQHMIDGQIHGLYRLWPNQFAAHDLLSGKKRFSNHYTTDDLATWERRLEKTVSSEDDRDALRHLILEMYANPVQNKHRVGW